MGSLRALSAVWRRFSCFVNARKNFILLRSFCLYISDKTVTLQSAGSYLPFCAWFTMSMYIYGMLLLLRWLFYEVLYGFFFCNSAVF